MPMNLTDLLNAKSLNKYYAGVKGTTLVEAMFPAVFSNALSKEKVSEACAPV